MHIVRIADVDGDSHRCVAQLQGLQLAIANQCPILDGAGFEVGNLHIEEGKIALAPLPAPVFDQSAEEAVIELGERSTMLLLSP